MATFEEIKNLFDSNFNGVNLASLQKDVGSIKDDMKKFKEDIKAAVFKALEPTNEKIDKLEKKLEEKDQEILSLRKDLDLNTRKKNIVLFGVQENENSTEELEAIVISLFQKVTKIEFHSNDFNDVFRFGKKVNDKCRPILVSFISHKNFRKALDKKQLFKNEDIGISQDLPKNIMEEKKRLPPMITAINNAGTKASLRLDEVFIEGRKLSKPEVEEQMVKFQSVTKRQLSPDEDESRISKKSRPKLKVKAAAFNPAKLNGGTIGSPKPTTSTTPNTSPKFSTPSKMFPVFTLPQNNEKGILSPLPGGSAHSKSFAYQSEK